MEHAYVDELPSDEESCYYAEHFVFYPDPDPTFPPPYTDDDLAEVLPYCPNIATAYLSGIPDLSSRTLNLLAENAHNLTYLDISGCTEVTDLGLHALATHSVSLTSIFINRIPGVTDHAVAALVRGLPRLLELESAVSRLSGVVLLREKQRLPGQVLQRHRGGWDGRMLRDFPVQWCAYSPLFAFVR